MAKQDQQILEAIDREIARLQQARALLAGTEDARAPARRSAISAQKPGRPKGGKRNLSPEARARIAAAQKKRWAKSKQEQPEEAASD